MQKNNRKYRDMVPEEVTISVVIPVYNEEDNLEPLLNELFPILKNLGRRFEVICVDDASTDSSYRVLQNLKNKYSQLRVIQHTINCGESAGQATGFLHARGEWVITMDADQQNDPADIPRLMKASQNVDGVCGVRSQREDDWVKRISSKVANGFRNWMTRDIITDAGCTFRALRRDALREIPVFNGMHRFLPTLLRLQGFTATEIAVNHRPRIRGESKYGIGNRMFRGLVDCVAILWWRKRSFPARRFLTENEVSIS